MCCKLLGIKELDKPRLRWCDLVQIGVGCGDYGRRPEACASFRCLWLDAKNDALSEDARPDITRVVMFCPPDGTVQVHVDPSRPTAWQQGATGRFVASVATGLPVLVTIGNARKVLGTREKLKDIEVRMGEDLVNKEMQNERT